MVQTLDFEKPVAALDAQIADLSAREPRISASELGRRIGVSRQHASGLLKRAQAAGTTPTHRAGTGGRHD